MAARCLAFDLGAESGRAMLATLNGGRIELAEIRRFANRPLSENGSLRWDVMALWSEMLAGLRSAPGDLSSIGVDTWGVDFALLGRDGQLLENPYHYRDRRTEGAMESVFAKVPRERIYEVTGNQFLPINTLFQLFAASRATPEVMERSERLLMIPDLLNYWMTGNCATEYTIASTTQLIDARTRSWAFELIDELGVPRRLFQPLVEPGRRIGTLAPDLSPAHAGLPVIAPACHDTGSAVAAIAMSPRRAFLSSGTWSLLGAELDAPVITPAARELNFTNEGGVCGTIRLLKNIAGLWLLQSCRRSWPGGSYQELLAAAECEPSLVSIIDPDHPSFLNPPDMTGAIARYCAATGQPAPATPAGLTRAILESLALRYREALESLEHIAQRAYDEIRIVGGGSRNRLLNQFTADSTGRRVTAGPVEATALGNIVMQLLALGEIESLAAARALITQSFPGETFEPRPDAHWDDAYQRFRELESRQATAQ